MADILRFPYYYVNNLMHLYFVERNDVSFVIFHDAGHDFVSDLVCKALLRFLSDIPRMNILLCYSVNAAETF